LTQSAELCNQERLNNILFNLHPETRMYLPDGTGFVAAAGLDAKELAGKSVSSLKKHDITIWEKHGLLSCGTSLSDAFDKCELLSKAATVYLMCRSAGIEIREN
jgi:rhamnulose-1-phosphate aldolase